jgi:H+/gluconate symporter-like permease
MAAIVSVAVANRHRLQGLRETMDAGANASMPPVLTVASLVGLGAVVAALPAFGMVRDWLVSIEARRSCRSPSQPMCLPL